MSMSCNTLACFLHEPVAGITYNVYLNLKTMVSAKVVSVSNTLISKTLPTSPTALFVGGTNGIGRTTLEAFAASTQSPTVFFVGRSQTAAEEMLRELETKINAKGTYGFYIANCTLLSEVDRVCEAVKERLEGQNKGLDYLFLSCGYVALARDGAYINMFCFR